MRKVLGIVIFLGVVAYTLTYSFERGPTLKTGPPKPCPGLYCGRTELNETHNSG